MKAKDDEKRRLIGVYDDRKRPSGVHATKMGPGDFQLHVHSDHGTGGHWCAKLFFFSLFVILLGLICLIIIENRDLEDLDRPLSESRYWIDDDLDTNDNHNGKNQMHVEDIVYQDQHEDEVLEESLDGIDEQENHSEEENELDNKSDDSVEIEDYGLGEEINFPSDSQTIERKTLNFKEIEIDDPLEHEVVEENEADELDSHKTEDEISDDEPIETNPLAVRIIVGLALVIVAHQVLLKKPRTNDDNTDQYQDPETFEESEEIIEMKRRFTLVTAEEPIPLSEEDMKEHPSIIEDILVTEDKECLNIPNSPTDEQIKDTSSEEEPFEDDRISDEIAIIEDKDLGSEVEEEEEEEEEILSSEDIYSDEEINDYESSENSDIDDSDLLKRLDEKYGKLPQHM